MTVRNRGNRVHRVIFKKMEPVFQNKCLSVKVVDAVLSEYESAQPDIPISSHRNHVAEGV
jgi:hypothetical protein